ncbi:MAG: sigma-70 family RNA polymerase sigma factor [Acidimicrobiia bacterium]
MGAAGAAGAPWWGDDDGAERAAAGIPGDQQHHDAEPVDLRAVVVEYRLDLFRYARSLTRNDADAEDLAQTAVLRALAARTVLHDPVKAKAYLLRIVRNLATDQARSRARVRVEPWADVPDGAAVDTDPDAALLRDAKGAVPRRALRKLAPAHREVLELRFVEELDYETVAERLETTEHAARQRVYRAMQAMRSLVRRNDPDLTEH